MTAESVHAPRQQTRQPALPTRTAQRAQQRTWRYLWTAFLIWCVLFLSGAYYAKQWLKNSYSKPPAILASKRGIVLYRGPRDANPVSISEHSTIEEGGVLELPASAEATVQLGVDNSTIRLRPGSKVELSVMHVGWFNRELTQVRLNQLAGAVDYFVAGELPNGRELEVRTPQSAQPQESIKLTKGEYLVWIQPTGTRLISYQGQAKADNGGSPIRLRDGKWAMLGTERLDTRGPLDLPEQLVKNRDFARGLGEAWTAIDVGEKGRPDVGGQRSVAEEIINNRSTRALRIVRDTAKDTHNETGLRQDVDREVWAYRSLTLSAWVKVNYASLDGGGYAGSEYPIMLRINYVAENGGAYTWARGFYYRNESNRPAEIGEQVTQGEWYRFSLDLTSVRDRPAYIASVEVFSSGHDYDAEVAAIELAAE
jgi:hypothetical protein